MKKFLVLYRSTVSASDQIRNATPEQAKAGMEAWMKWAGGVGEGILDMGSPVSAAAKIDGSGTVSAADSQVGGFSILQAESKEALVSGVLKNHPHFMSPGASIEVFEYLSMPGM